MRTKAHRYSASVPASTFTTGTDVIGLTGDFDGGFVQASTVVFAVPGAGNWINAQFKLDGVLQGPTMYAYQSGGNVAISHTVTLRVPQGRHRIAVQFGTGGAPLPSSTADLSVAELNA
jgi:hypothetical protein